MGISKRALRAMRRLNANEIKIENPQGVDATLFANEAVDIELSGVTQALNFISLQDTIEAISAAERLGQCAPFWGDDLSKGLERVVLTPDMHKSSGIPVGTVAQTRACVIPQAIGNDICCGMRFLTLDLTRDELVPHLDALAPVLRGIFFEGQRALPMSPDQREAMLREGLPGLHATSQEHAGVGLWRYYDASAQEEDLSRVHLSGGLAAEDVFVFGDYIKASGTRDGRDAQIGSVGGGNHFVEVQVIENILNGGVAHAWGLKKNAVALMVHSGSVGLGRVVGQHFKSVASRLFPNTLRKPTHGFSILPTVGPNAHHARAYLDAMRNAANFGYANRLFLGLMAVRAISEVLGRRVEARLIYDAPHNLIWTPPSEDGLYLHRKGACPAPGANPWETGPFRDTGHPVIIPGSMGSASYLLAGRGHEASLCSACHGAGRLLSRGRARKVEVEVYEAAMEPLRVVTPIDPRAHQVRKRPDILAKYHDRLKEEAPYAYKSISPVIQTVEDAEIADGVARMWPLMTIKG